MKTMRNFVFAMCMCLIFSNLSAQQNAGLAKKCNLDEEKIKSEKVAFLTEKINLTVDESQRFWPLYNEKNAVMDSLYHEERRIRKSLKNSSLTDSEIDAKMRRMLEIRKQCCEKEIFYYEAYKKVLPMQKIVLLHNSQREFRRYLLQKYKAIESIPK